MSQSWNWSLGTGDRIMAKSRPNAIRMAQRSMRQDRSSEFRALTSPDAPSTDSAIVALSKRVGDLEVQMQGLMNKIAVDKINSRNGY